MVYELITKRRTIRKFLQKKIDPVLLEKFVDAARLAPSAANRQPLEFVVVNQEKLVGQIFEHTQWAGYIKPYGRPQKGQEPVAFICIVVNKEISSRYYTIDCGAAAQNLVLAALEEGIGSCIIGAFDKKSIEKMVGVPKQREVVLVVAFGYPAEQPMAEHAGTDSIQYYKDEQGTLHVPKRELHRVLYFNHY